MMRGAAITKNIQSVIKTGHTLRSQNERSTAHTDLASSASSSIHTCFSMTGPTSSLLGFRPTAGKLKWPPASVSVACLVLGLRSGEPPYYLVSAFAALLAWSAYGTAPHAIRAAKALESNARPSAGIAIEITQWSDSPTYHAEVRLASQAIWRITFIAQA